MKNKLKILINYNYTSLKIEPGATGSYFELAAKRRDDCVAFRKGGIDPSECDIILNIEQTDEIITHPNAYNVYYEIDNHTNRGRVKERYEKVDRLFIAQKNYDCYYPQPKTKWLPLACDPEFHKRYEDEAIIYDIAFLGNESYPRRREFLDMLSRHFKVYRGIAKSGEPYSRIFNKANLIFNCSMDGDVNMRVFEGIACGRCLITDTLPSQNELFEPFRDFVPYTDKYDLFEKARFLLADEAERESIALRGSAKAHAFHSYDERLRVILNDYVENKKS